ncbi:oligopeptide transport system permease protein [Pedobacter sp. UYEF25]
MDRTPSQQVWYRLRKNWLAFGGLIFIVLLMFTGVLGYLIMPDNSPFANNMHLQITNKKPGSTFTFMVISKNRFVKKRGLFRKMLFGQEPDFKSIPISSYRINGSSVYVREYIGDDEVSEERKFNLATICTGCSVILGDKAKAEAFRSQTIYQKTFWFGTDIYGRDLLSRMILGIRVSLSVGLIAVFISLSIGISLGAISGYYGGKIDAAITWFMNVVWSLPSLLLVIAISFALGKGFWQIFIAVGLSTWVDVARLVRGQVMVLKNIEFVEAAKALGFSDSRIIIKHILPNIAGPILVVASANFASAILLETGLSFLGFGAQPPMPSWGSMIKEHYGYIIMDAAYLAFFPGIAIMLTVYAFNVLAIGLRDAFDVKTQNFTV